MKVPVLMTWVFLASSLLAQDCTTNLRGEKVCKNGNAAAAVNPNTGNAAVAHRNSNGVTTTQTSNGGEAKTKNGMGVAPGPGDTTCAKGKNHEGCKK
jgi:hypothetical protein